nr:hypothetical protein Iba_chr04eCG1410 [Ipomoea batatas]
MIDNGEDGGEQGGEADFSAADTGIVDFATSFSERRRCFDLAFNSSISSFSMQQENNAIIPLLLVDQVSEALFYEQGTMAIKRCNVNLCCCASTAAIAEEASFPNIAVFDFRSCNFASAASSFIAMSGLPFPSLSFACRLDTSTAYLG